MCVEGRRKEEEGRKEEDGRKRCVHRRGVCMRERTTGDGIVRARARVCESERESE